MSTTTMTRARTGGVALIEQDGRYAFGMVTAHDDGRALEVRLFGTSEPRHHWERLYVLPTEVDGYAMGRGFQHDRSLPVWWDDVEDARELARRYKR